MDNVNTYKVNKEAVKKIAEKVYDNGSTVINRNDLEELFPELQESGDERMIKFIKQQLFNIKKTITENYELDAKLTKAIDWLEKQGNLMKALQISNAKIGELIEKNYYLKEQLEKQGKNNMGISEATKQKLEDNLNKALEKETPESCNEFLDKQGEQNTTIEMKTPEESLGIDSDTYNKIVDECIYGEQKPIKEHNACEFCEDKYGCVSPCSMKLIEEEKPTDKIESRQEELTEFEKAVKQVMEEAIECGDTHNLKADADMLLRLVQKSSWSEEDIELLNNTIKFIEDSVAATPPSLRTYNPTLTGKEIPFLKALKDRVQLKQEWSEEDNRMCKAVIDNIQAICEEGYFVGNIDSGELIEWLKSLKDRYVWRPSDEQMGALANALSLAKNCGEESAFDLRTLYEQLKKLREK